MTEVALLEQINKSFDAILSSSENVIMAQKNGDNVRVNVGSSILIFDKSIFNFTSKYTMMSKSQIATAKKQIEEIKVFMAVYIVSVTPKSWGYRFDVYNGLKRIKTIKLRLYVTDSPIICWTYMIRQFFGSRPKPKSKVSTEA